MSDRKGLCFLFTLDDSLDMFDGWEKKEHSIFKRGSLLWGETKSHIPMSNNQLSFNCVTPSSD